MFKNIESYKSCIRSTFPPHIINLLLSKMLKKKKIHNKFKDWLKRFVYIMYHYLRYITNIICTLTYYFPLILTRPKY